MINKNQPTEKLAEEILRAYAHELKQCRATYYNAIEDDSVQNPPLFSELKVQNICTDVHKHKKKFNNHKIISRRRLLILIAVLVLIMGLAIISSEGVKKQMFNFLQTDNEGYTELNYLNSLDLKDGQFPEFELEYVPKGYIMMESTSNTISHQNIYLDEQENRIIFSVFIAEDYTPSVDNDTFKRKEITINGYQAFLFYDETENNLIWQVGDYVFNILSTIDENEIIKIAEHIRVKN